MDGATSAIGLLVAAGGFSFARTGWRCQTAPEMVPRAAKRCGDNRERGVVDQIEGPNPRLPPQL